MFHPHQSFQIPSPFSCLYSKTQLSTLLFSFEPTLNEDFDSTETAYVKVTRTSMILNSTVSSQSLFCFWHISIWQLITHLFIYCVGRIMPPRPSKVFTFLISGICNYIFHGKRDFVVAVTVLRTLRWEIILGFLSGPEIIAWILKSREACLAEVRRCD